MNNIYLIIFNATVLYSNANIQGYITDAKSKEPLIGVNIILDGTILRNTSDKNRYYSINNIPIVGYTICAMFYCYETQKKRC